MLRPASKASETETWLLKKGLAPLRKYSEHLWVASLGKLSMILANRKCLVSESSTQICEGSAGPQLGKKLPLSWMNLTGISPAVSIWPVVSSREKFLTRYIEQESSGRGIPYHISFQFRVLPRKAGTSAG